MEDRETGEAGRRAEVDRKEEGEISREKRKKSVRIEGII